MGQEPPQGAPPAVVQHLSSRQGLSHRWVFHITQDSRGFLWVSTYDGLNRYDGNEFKVFRPSAAGGFPQSADRMQWHEEISDGHFIVATEGGIFDFDPFDETFALLHPPVNSLFVLPMRRAGEDIWKLADKYHTLPEELVLSQFAAADRAFRELLRVKTPISPGTEAHWAGHAPGKLWFWARSGAFYILDTQTRQWEKMGLPDLIRPSAPIDRKGRCWYLDASGQLRFAQLPAGIPLEDWKEALFDGARLWLFRKGRTQGLYALDASIGVLEEKASAPGLGLGDDRVFFPRAVLEDAEGNIWLGGFQGLTKVRPGKALFRKYLDLPVLEESIPPVGFSARAMAEDATGNIFVLENAGALHQIHPENGKTEQIALRPLWHPARRPVNQELSVFHLAGGADGRLWLATATGLASYDPLSGECLLYPLPGHEQMSNYLLIDRRGRLWAQDFLDRLYLFDIEHARFDPVPIEGANLHYAGAESEDGRLWGFYDQGLLKVDTEQRNVERIALFRAPRDQRCMTWHRGFLWIGSSKGLTRVHPETFEHKTYSRANGLPGDFIYSMLADGDYLWLGASDGLCRFDIRTEETRNFFIEDGLSHYEFNSHAAFKARNGRFYMGGLNGVNAFFPEALASSGKAKPRLLWSNFSYYDSARDTLFWLKFGHLDTARTIVLPPSGGSFTIYMALTSYADPSKNQYAWQLEGYDSERRYAGSQPFAAYNQLPPGNYVFRARAADPFGNWSANELAIPIKVLRPWYSRWWAWLMYASAMAGLIFALYRFQLNRKLEHAENLRLREIDQFKSRFFANITHEFRTPLTVILGTSEQLAGSRGQGAVGSGEEAVGGGQSAVGSRR